MRCRNKAAGDLFVDFSMDHCSATKEVCRSCEEAICRDGLTSRLEVSRHLILHKCKTKTKSESTSADHFHLFMRVIHFNSLTISHHRIGRFIEKGKTGAEITRLAPASCARPRAATLPVEITLSIGRRDCGGTARARVTRLPLELWVANHVPAGRGQNKHRESDHRREDKQ